MIKNNFLFWLSTATCCRNLVNLFLMQNLKNYLAFFTPKNTFVYVKIIFFSRQKQVKFCQKPKDPTTGGTREMGLRVAWDTVPFMGFLFTSWRFFFKWKKLKNETLLGVLITKFKRKTPSSRNKKVPTF